jgi:hypothetical protein
MRRSLPFSVLLCLLAGTAFADERVRFDDPNEAAHRAAAFNRAVGALPIDPVDGNQIRVWFYAYWSGEIKVTGYIVTSKGVWRCKLEYEHGAEDIRVHRGGSCNGPHRYAERLDKVIALIGEASKFNGQTVLCKVFDGWGATIEGNFEGKPFVFTADNTDECTDTNPEAARVNEFLDLVSAAYSKKDEGE